MAASATCNHCATAIPPTAPQGLCPRCLLGTGLSLYPNFAREPKRQNATPAFRSGDYELIEEIARGGMGVVFRARQISLDRIVAVKALLFGKFASDEFVSRFRAEAQAAAGLQHPNIVAIHEVWEHAGQHFFSMEYIEGRTLAEALKDGPLTTRRAARYAQIIARAIAFAHEHGILHRDLKPSNVLLDANDQPRITDFGLAKRLDDADHSASRILGSPQYMSPEQAGQAGSAVGPRSDVYSMGAILYHMITGRPPVVGNSVEEILAQTLKGELMAPRLLNGSIPRDLETICLKCLQKDPQRRYASAQEVAEDLERFIQNKPIHARPVGQIEKAQRWCRRNPALAVIFVLLALVASSSTWFSMRLRRLNNDVRIHAYVSDMNAAFQHSEQGDTGYALELLKQQVPRRGEVDLRGFEWRHLWWLCRGNFQQWLPNHPQVVGAIHFSTNGQTALTYAWNNVVRVWDIETRHNLLKLEKVSGLGGFSQDERSLVLSRADGSLQIIDARTGATNRVIPNTGELVAYARQSQTAVTLDRSHTLRVWNLESGRELLSIPKVTQNKIEYGWSAPIIISPDGSRLALIGANANVVRPTSIIRLWDVAAAKELEPLRENRELRCAVFSPDSQSLASGDGEGSVRIWNLATREERRFKAHSSPTLSLAFSPDGKSLATGGADQKSIKLWDTTTLLPKQYDLLGQAGDVWSLSFSADGKRLASGTREGLVRIWTLDATPAPNELERLHADEYANITFSPNGRLFAGGCNDRTVKIWDVATAHVFAKIKGVSYVVAFSADGRRILVSDVSGAAFWWDLQNGTSQPVPNFKGDLGKISSVDTSRDRKLVAVGLADGAIRVLEIDTGRVVGPDLLQHTGAVRSVTFSPKGDKLASGGKDKSVMMWDVKSGAALGMCPEHKGGVFGVAISADGETLASGCGADTVKLWRANNVSKGSWASVSHHKSVIRSLSFSPDNRTLASGSDDKTVKLWNITTLSSRREVSTFTLDAAVRAVLFSPDGNTLAAVTDSGTVRLFRAVPMEEGDRQLREMR